MSPEQTCRQARIGALSHETGSQVTDERVTGRRVAQEPHRNNVICLRQVVVDRSAERCLSALQAMPSNPGRDQAMRDMEAIIVARAPLRRRVA